MRRAGSARAFLDGVPMLVISGGPRTDTPHRYQLHQMDTHRFMGGLTKATFRVERQEDVVPILFRAYEIAVSGEPGPVFVEIPVNVLLLTDEVAELPQFQPRPRRASRPPPKSRGRRNAGRRPAPLHLCRAGARAMPCRNC